MKEIRLKKSEGILAVVPEMSESKGKDTCILKVYIGDYATSQFRTVCVQILDTQEEVMNLFDPAESLSRILVKMVNKYFVHHEAD